jgi:prepilin-type N-terminal cleavage/methylation domain-containing protein
MKRSKGFTLVELMIILSIVGILAAVIAPVIYRVSHHHSYETSGCVCK